MSARKSPTDLSCLPVSQIRNPASPSPFRQNPRTWRDAVCSHPATRRGPGSQPHFGVADRRISIRPGLAARGFMGLVTDSEDGAALEIHEITFDARDPHALAAFWAALLEREIRPGDMPQDDSVLVVPVPGQPGLLFLRVPEGKTAKKFSPDRSLNVL